MRFRRKLFSYFHFVFFFPALAVFSEGRAAAFFSVTGNCRDAYARIVDLKLEEARVILREEQVRTPGNCIPVYLENYIDFLTLFIREEQKDFVRMKANKDIRLTRLSAGNKSSPWYLFTQAEVNLQWAFARIKFGEYYTAAWEIRKAYGMLMENKERFPAFTPNLKGLGMLHAAVGAVPEQYQWIVRIIGMEGSIAGGMNEMNQVLAMSSDAEGGFLRTEAVFMASYIACFLKNNEEEAWAILDRSAIAGSPLMCFVRSSIAMHAGYNDRAVSCLMQCGPDPARLRFAFLDYMRGVTLLNRLDPGADIYFLRFLSGFSGKHYIRAAYQKLAWHYLVHGDEKKYREYIAVCLKTGNDFVDEDKQALREAASGEMPNMVLLRARLLSDGGYYHRAIAEIAGCGVEQFPRLRDQLEVTYRMGKINHKMNNTDKAAEYYRQTFKNGFNLQWYFSANSALQLGLIMEQKKEYAQARSWYEQCLRMRDHEYQNSIDQKARSGLNRLKDK